MKVTHIFFYCDLCGCDLTTSEFKPMDILVRTIIPNSTDTIMEQSMDLCPKCLAKVIMVEQVGGFNQPYKLIKKGEK